MSDEAVERAAEWMCRELRESGQLWQPEAAETIAADFGSDLVEETERGGQSITKPVLAAFHELCPEALYDRRSRLWYLDGDAD